MAIEAARLSPSLAAAAFLGRRALPATHFTRRLPLLLLSRASASSSGGDGRAVALPSSELRKRRSSASATGEDSKLGAIRRLFVRPDIAIDAYIVPSQDAHQSEFIAECFMRRTYLTGFTGSAGTAVVTKNNAAFWTDGRYFLQAEKELSHEWTLMRSGNHGVPTTIEWLNDVLPSGCRIGIDPFLFSFDAAEELKDAIANKNHELIMISDFNLVDEIWGESRPEPPKEPVRVHDIKYAGIDVPSKLSYVRSELAENGCESVVISMLDEIAWLLNMRGSDVPHSPVFYSYLIVEMSTATLFVDRNKVSEDVLEHLEKAGVTLKPYNAILSSVERDAAALAEFWCWLEEEVRKTVALTEVQVAEKLLEFRQKQDGFIETSFDTISGYGANGAIIHYRPTPDSCSSVGSDNLFLLDSGAQYIDGTTDITRTVHFGEPSQRQKECFTRVLQGHIALDQAVFPERTPGFVLDVLARSSLWKIGLDYRHGTGHGVGAALNVHEGPQSISYRYGNLTALQKGMIVSNEPGYYEDNSFGIRIENLVLVKEVNLANSFGGISYLGFEKLTFVPIQGAKKKDILFQGSIVSVLEAQLEDSGPSQALLDLINGCPLATGDEFACWWQSAVDSTPFSQ
ncbi:hypothetical protein BRADI_1g54327v3 [Brachypodium distachyon]|uniref:Uncharacterized protein n=1 Tax=Brachypodium distachyon TaxID=15368 RepID=A0A0Q3NSD1_BRADI|nr:hypothetical protein BRADI_1g54327v3 [Brachypodium distachyon]